MNLLDLVPAFARHLRQYRKPDDTDSVLAGYLADGIQALEYRWDRSHVIEFTSPATYHVSPDVADGDIRTVVLMASIIYKMGNYSLARFTDGDFSYDPQNAWRTNPITFDVLELKERLPATQLAVGRTAPMRGFNNWFNGESYDHYGYIWGVIGDATTNN
jgi:hypothetical protein